MGIVIVSMIFAVLLLIGVGAILTQRGIRLVGFVLFLQSILFVIVSVGSYGDIRYRRGQIDAANGKQKYHLTTQPDNTQLWELKKK